MLIVIKILFCALITFGCVKLCQFLVIPALLPSALAAWGFICFLFSGELAGRKRRVRNGIEDKPPLRIMWMIAGILCVLLAVGVLFLQA